MPLVSVVAVVAGAAISVVAWQATLSDRPTGARSLAWFYADGTPTSGANCGDIELSTIVDGDVLWTPCGPERAGDGDGVGLARIEPARGRAVLFPFPTQSSFAGQSLGAATSRDGSLCWAFVHEEIGGQTAVAVAGTDGWIHEPQLIPNGERSSKVLAMDWRAGHCELVVGRAKPLIVTVTEAGLTSRPLSSRWSELCNEAKGLYCGWPTAAFRDNGKWSVVYRAPFERENPEGRAAVLREDGVLADYDPSLDALVDSRADRVDRSRLGRLVEDSPFDFIMTSEGRVVAAPPTDVRGEPYWRGDFTSLGDGGLYRTRWWAEGERVVIDFGGPLLEIREETDASWRLTHLQSTAETRSAIIARTPTFECSLHRSSFVERPDGGFWIVGPQGCFLGLDADLQRTDPLSLLEHLRRRGSRGSPAWDEREHERYLGWCLFGFAPCLLLSWLVRRRRRLISAVMPGAMIFALTAGFALSRVLWLLG